MPLVRDLQESVFPARAGMILSLLGATIEKTGIPRESGDDPVYVILLVPELPYSPRERG